MEQTTERVDDLIGQVERFYRSLTGHNAPPTQEVPYAPIPPERDPERHLAEPVDLLGEMAFGIPLGWDGGVGHLLCRGSVMASERSIESLDLADEVVDALCGLLHGWSPGLAKGIAVCLPA